MNFKNSETQELFDFWIGLHPDSFHALDMERMYNFVYSMFIAEDSIDVDSLTEILIEKKGWSENYADEQSNLFIDKIDNTLEVLRYLRDNSRLVLTTSA